ncbi:hypothetical protein KSS87_023589 [Heliosperma pusillum]|nr:hypothetical protein KSS87_023589 [Heliosperma pusillum]
MLLRGFIYGGLDVNGKAWRIIMRVVVIFRLGCFWSLGYDSYRTCDDDHYSCDHGPRPSQPQALNVPPLNSMPYIDPVASMCLSYENKFPADTKPEESAKPALVYLPSQPTKEEWHNILSVTSNGIGLTGSAAAGTMGPILGKREIGECEDSYIFRVSLPGVARGKI